jgi:hypothetical protein
MKELPMTPLRHLRTVRNLIRHRHQLGSFLSFCEHAGTAFYGTINSPEELAFLKELVVAANALEGPIVEIGTLFGFTTQRIACWKEPSKKLLTVDNYSWNPMGLSRDSHRNFTERNLVYLTEKCCVEIFAMSSDDFYRNYKGIRPSMIFIDSSHDYDTIRMDVSWSCQQRIRIIAGHDYSNSWPDVRRAVDEVLGENKRVVQTLWARVSDQLS